MPFGVLRIGLLTLVRIAAAFGASPPHGLVILGLPVTTAARFLTAAMNFVDSGPGAALSLVFRHAPALVAFFNVLRLSFFLVGVFRFVPAWHLNLQKRA
jgi:hypothetical protein